MLLQDLRYALRTLLTQKTFTAVVVVCLGAGAGVNAMWPAWLVPARRAMLVDPMVALRGE